jgi:two-component system osmolarity sensor histidine kinase EnvZ
MAQRTEMLAGVSHDLRTPLTRMKLQLEMLDGQVDIGNLKADLRDMEDMVEGFLDFARGQGTEEPELANLADILVSVVDGANRQGHDIELTSSGDLRLQIRPNAIKRCLTNLVDNAIKHAGSHGPISITAVRLADTIEITVDDSGPGILKDKRDQAFQAFVRLDSARSPETGGVGLGLTIARDIAHGHGGEVTLGESGLGGLRAQVRLPV